MKYHRFYFDVHKVCGKLGRRKLHWVGGRHLFFQWIWTRYVYFYISLWKIMPSCVKNLHVKSVFWYYMSLTGFSLTRLEASLTRKNRPGRTDFLSGASPGRVPICPVRICAMRIQWHRVQVQVKLTLRWSYRCFLTGSDRQLRISKHMLRNLIKCFVHLNCSCELDRGFDLSQ